jgi:TonB-linked SusC/RagA family outer membrane protein
MKKSILLVLLIIVMKQFSIAQVTITGTVTSSDDGLGMPGVAVFVKGTTIGTSTNIDGKYSLTVPTEAKTLIFSFVGMSSQEIVLNGQTEINVVLGVDVFNMDEVVVAGVASATPKRKLSVSVTKVDSKELEDVPATSAASALQGKVAGVTVVSGSGNPGQSATIRLRGSNSLFESQSPLILVDGVMFEGSMADLNADDIASMEVVKGASAAALYGSKAGSGVVVISSKRGKLNEDGISEIKIRNEFGSSNLVKNISMNTHHAYLLADDYKQPLYTKYKDIKYPANYEGGRNLEIVGNRLNAPDHYADNPYSFTNDPQNEIFKAGQFYTNYVSLSTSGKKTAFFTSFENNKNTGIVWNSKGSSRQNFRINVDHKITDNLKISTSTLITKNTVDKPGMSGSSSPFFNVLLMNPDVNLNLKAPDDLILQKYYFRPDAYSNGENPKHQLFYESSTEQRNDILQNIIGNWKIANWINIDADYSFEKLNASYMSLREKGYLSGNDTSKGSQSKIVVNALSESFKATANMQFKLGDLIAKSKLNYIYENFENEKLFASGNGMMGSNITNMANLDNKESFLIASPSSKTLAYNYSGIVDLDYKDKYIASALYRLDGSSTFGAKNRWHPYYRISMAYRINEDIHIPNFQELKIYLANGGSGQRPGFDYQYEIYPIQTNSILAMNGGLSANQYLKPANTTETTIGINSSFLEMFEIEIIRSWANTEGIFYKKRLPAATGFSAIWWNAVTASTNTWEITLGSQIIKNKNINWNINLTLDQVNQKITQTDVPEVALDIIVNNSEVFIIRPNTDIGTIEGNDWVTSLDQMKNQLPTGKTINDYALNSEGYVILKGTEGVAEIVKNGKIIVDGEKPILLDQNNDGVPDRVNIGNFNPDFNFSFFTKFTYKNLGLTMLWNWKQGGDVYNLTRQYMYINYTHGDIDQSAVPDYKKKTVDYYATFYNFSQFNKRFVEDGTYLKLRELSLYYNIKDKNSSFLRGMKIKNMKISCLGRNLLTLTKYKGWDPEVSARENNGSLNNSYALDNFSYPNFRTYSVSFEFTF